ncbi:MAG: FAD-dependent monooxygenase [Burkholderiaceae bacterium]|jgi:2-polyprenyl-6-methoxyphenol hydroxylase-like FAD-dependent oxidoreductase
MATTFDICIRGAGIVGRTLALLLAREHLRVALVAPPGVAPPATSGHSDVRAYAMNAASRALLESLRVWPDETSATPVLRMEVSGDDGGLVNFDAGVQATPALTWIVDVPALEARLSEAVRYQPQIEVLQGPAPAALTVVCEGKASRTRAEYGVEFNVKPYGQHAIATRLTCEKPHGQVAWQWFSGGDILAFLPLGGRLGNSVAVVWSVHQERAPALLATSPEEFTSMLETASHHTLGKLTLQGERASWPLQLARADRWVGPGWALAGDAAHTVHPLSGQGLNLGLGDVAELARVLKSREDWRPPGDLKLLRRYERARKADVLSTSLATDSLQQLFSLGGSPAQALRNWGMSGFDRSGPLKDWVARRAMGTLNTLK